MMHLRKTCFYHFCFFLAAAAVTVLLLMFGNYLWHPNYTIVDAAPTEESMRADWPLPEILSYQGIPVSADREQGIIYLSCPAGQGVSFYDAVKDLAAYDERFTLSFVRDPAMQDIPAAMRSNHPFRLIVSGVGEEFAGQFMECSVIFTSLPVLQISGTEDFTLSTYALWSPGSSGVAAGAESGFLQYRARGAHTRSYEKHPLRLSLCTGEQKKEHRNLLGLGSDDDWILNSMVMDDLNLRDPFLTELWNQLARQTDYNMDGSRGHYVEVVINDQYRGVYFLQRRVDKKYLQLNDSTILLKGRPSWAPDSIPDAYEIVSSPFSEEETYQRLAPHLTPDFHFPAINPQNFMDVSLLVQFGAAFDNFTFKNMFYLFFEQGTEPQVLLVPWDMDMSLGIGFTDQFTLDPEEYCDSLINRKEYDVMKEQYPDLDQQLARRWFALRKSLYSEQNLKNTLEQLCTNLYSSGGMIRDNIRNGLLYGERDTPETMWNFILYRLDFLDEYYRSFLQ